MQRVVLAWCVMAIMSLGCGTSQDGVRDVWGAVTVDGKSVGDGAIYFMAAESKAVLGFAKIRGGRYQGKVTPGRARVRITADRLVPGQNNEAGNTLIEQYIPSRYNEATELGATIDRSQRLDWNLRGDR